MDYPIASLPNEFHKIQKYLMSQGIDYNTKTPLILKKLYQQLNLYPFHSDNKSNFKSKTIKKVLNRIAETSSLLDSLKIAHQLTHENGICGIRLSESESEAIVIKFIIKYTKNNYVYLKTIKIRLFFIGNSIIKVGSRYNGVPNLLPTQLYPELKDDGGNTLFIDDFSTVMKRFVKLNIMLLETKLNL